MPDASQPSAGNAGTQRHNEPWKAIRWRFVLALLAGTIAGCGGGSGPAASSQPPLPPPPPLSATFSSIQANVFTPSCATAGCHAPGNPPLGLILDEASSYMLLVGVDSGQVAGLKRVQPGNPDASYLVRKLEGSAGAGGQMPLDQAPLPQATIDVIRQWITDGALDDRVQSAAPIRITSLAPPPGVVLDVAPAQIIAGFDREPDASTVNANTFLLEASGNDGSFGEGNEVPITAASITVPNSNRRSAIFDLAGSPLADDTYRVSLLGAGASFLMDLDGNALDGEFIGALPSGDGTAGGNFRAIFGVTTPGSAAATLDSIQATVFGPSCSGCHGGPTSNVLPSGMDLSSADASFNALVGVASLQEPAVLRVDAMNPDGSYLVQKLEGTATTGSRMPQGGPFLDQATMNNIRQWITDGALR